MSDNGGGPAFPAPGVTGYENENSEIQFINWPGMTLRDYFAAKAMQGFLANSDCPPTRFLPEQNAEYFYRIADAMLAERSKP